MAKYKLFGKTIFEVEREQRSIEIPSGNLSNPTEVLTQALSNNAVGGVNVTTATAITLSAVWRAINVISGTLAGLPLKHYDLKDETRVVLRKSPASRVLKTPNELMTGYLFRESLQAMALGFGNGYGYIKRNAAGIPEEVTPIHPNDCLPIKYMGKMYYKIRINNQYFTVLGDDMIHIPGLSFNGVMGFSIISVARESLGGALATQKFGNKFYENGANIGGVLETPGQLSEKAYSNLKESWNKQTQGLEKTGSTPILEGGTKFTKIGIEPEAAQFLETRQFQVTEVARWFGVPPHLLFDLDRSTNNNIEHQGMEFVTYTLLPWANRWEEELSRKLIPTNQRDTQYIEHEFSGLLRADAKSRSEYYKGMFSVGSISPNQINQLENLPTYEGGDQRYVQAAFVPIDKIAGFYEGKSAKIQSPKDEEDK